MAAKKGSVNNQDILVQYGVYDTFDNELLIYMGSSRQIAHYFGVQVTHIRSAVSKGILVEKRYLIKKIEEESQ